VELGSGPPTVDRVGHTAHSTDTEKPTAPTAQVEMCVFAGVFVRAILSMITPAQW
jgi:hypothetical protein